MTVEMLVAELEQAGIHLKAEDGKLKLEAPADRVPSQETIATLRENKLAILEYLRRRERIECESDGYHARAEAALNAICMPSSPPGMIQWLEKGDPSLYDDLTRRLPDLLHALWTARAPLNEFQPVVDSWLVAHRRACGLFRGARRVFSGGRVLLFDLNGTVPAMPKGVRLLEWNPKTPPLAISYCTVVTDVERFMAATLAELRAAMKGQRWLAGHGSVRELMDRLEQVGVRVEIESPESVTTVQRTES